MTPTAEATIAALRATHDQLVDVVRDLSDEQLLAPSGAAEWPVAQVLSHLGSGAEIGRATLGAALEGATPLATDFNSGVWDRWNAMSPREQADGYLTSDRELVEAFEALTPQQRADLQVDVGFLPAPLTLATYAGMRLNEAAQHSWDVRVAFDAGAAIDEATAALLVEHLASGLGFLLGFSAKAAELTEPAIVALGDLGHALAVTDAVSLVPPTETPTARMVASADAVARLVAGRLAPGRTPPGVTVSGNVSLDDLRRVFPGY